ncbi:mediator complex subunit [Tulasnella sp. 418]|nr:mediator complex subunit [Tulasnella sp. 418]
MFPSSFLIDEYLSEAIEKGLIPLPSFIHVFPESILATADFAMQPDLISRTLSLAIKPYKSAIDDGSKPFPIFLSPSESPVKNAKTVEAVVRLLRYSATLPGSIAGIDGTVQNNEQLPIGQTLCTILLLLLSAISSPVYPSIPPEAAASLMTSLADLTQMYPLPPEAQSAIDEWFLRVTISSGSMGVGEGFDILGIGIPDPSTLNINDNQKPANAQTEEEVAPVVSEEEDITASTTILMNLLECRGSTVYGPASLSHATSLLLATYRSTAISTPQQHRRAASTASPAPGHPHSRTHTTTGSIVGQTPQGVTPRFQARTPAAGATPHTHGVVHGSGGVSLANTATTPSAAGASSMLHQAQTPGGLVATAAHTPGVRTPGNMPRTPGTIGKVTTSPPSMRSNKPSQARAQLFYEKLLLAASVLIADAENIEDALHQDNMPSDKTESTASSTSALRRSFVLGRLPLILARFQLVAGACSSTSAAHRPNFSAALESSLATLFSAHSSILDACDPWNHPPSKTNKPDGSMMLDEDDNAESRSRGRPPYRQLLLSALVRHQLISAECATNLYPEFNGRDRNNSGGQLDNDEDMGLSTPQGGDLSTSPQRSAYQQATSLSPTGLVAEAQANGLDIDLYLEMKISSEPLFGNLKVFDRAVADYACHAAISTVIQKRLSTLTSMSDLKSLSELCTALYRHRLILDIVSLHVLVSSLASSTLSFLNTFDMESVGDPQLTFTYLGQVALFIQYCIYRFNLGKVAFTSLDGRTVSATFPAPVATYNPSSLDPKEINLVSNWLKSVFGAESEGIGDNLLRSTQPKALLRLAGTLFVQAIAGVSKSDDLLAGGASYFFGPLLNWTLPVVIRGLAEESLRKGYRAKLELEVLQALVLDPQCPLTVLQMTASNITRLIGEPIMEPVLAAASFNVPEVRRILHDATIGITSVGSSFTPLEPKALIKQFISIAFTTSAPPSLSPLLYYTYQEVMEAVFATLFAARLSDYLPAGRNLSVALFNLPTPLNNTRPILPFFLTVFLPGKLPWIDHQPSAERTRAVNILVALVSSSLVHALRVERANCDVSSYDAGNINRTGADSDAMEVDEKGKAPESASVGRISGLATNFSKRLKTAGNSASAKLIHQQLLSNPSFASNFPSFAA